MRKFLTKSLARKFNPVIESMEKIKTSANNRKLRIRFLRSFPIFKQYIFIQHYCNVIHNIPFLPYFFFDYETALLGIKPCMSMYPIYENHSNSDICKLFLENSYYTDNTISFYTDGSKLEKDAPTGASVYSPNLNLNIMHRLPAETSVFTAEAWAIYLAIGAIMDVKCEKAVIFTDSKSVLDALATPLLSNKNYLIHYIKRSWLNCINKGIELYLFWVPAHKGITGNEIADLLAKRASIHGYKPNFNLRIHCHLRISSLKLKNLWIKRLKHI